MDLAQADEEREEREHEIYLEYPEYYEDEGILEEEKWLEEFLNRKRPIRGCIEISGCCM